MSIIHGREYSDSDLKLFLDDHFEVLEKNKDRRTNTTMSMMPENSKILDFGCGWGYYASKLSKRGNTVEAIDYENEIEICHKYWGALNNVNFTTKKIGDYANETFDAVLSCQVIEHVHNPGNYLSSVNRVLKEEGVLVISLPNIINPRYIFPHFNGGYQKKLETLSSKMLSNYDKVNHHVNSWDPRHFVILLASLGFQLSEYKTSEGIPLPTVFPFNKIGGGYINNFISKMGLFRNFSYTMHFTFVKKQKITIENND